jgi:hypothetical protein
LRPLDRCDRVEMRTASVRHYNGSLFRVLNTRNALVTGGLKGEFSAFASAMA